MTYLILLRNTRKNFKAIIYEVFQLYIYMRCNDDLIIIIIIIITILIIIKFIYSMKNRQVEYS